MNTASALRERAKQKLASTTGASSAAGGGPATSSQRASAGGASQPFETSDGAMRLNRLLLDAPSTAPSSRSPLRGGRGRSESPGPPSISSQRRHRLLDSAPAVSSSSANATSGGGGKKNMSLDYVPPSTIQLPDPTDADAVGLMTCYISGKLRIDKRSIGGSYCASDGKVEARTGYVTLRDGWEDDTTMTSPRPTRTHSTTNANAIPRSSAMPPPPSTASVDRVTNECLFSMCVSQFDLSVGTTGGPSGGKRRRVPIAKKGRNKLRYVALVRSTNRPLLRPPRALFGTGGGSNGGVVGGGGLQSSATFDDDDDDDDDNNEDDDDDDDDDVDEENDDMYDTMFNPDPIGGGTPPSPMNKKIKRLTSDKSGNNRPVDADTVHDNNKKKTKKTRGYDNGIPKEYEISSFPALYCLAIHADGTKPDVRKVLELDKLISIENAPPRKNAPPGSAGYVILVFRNGDAVEIDCDLPNAVMHHADVVTGVSSTTSSSGGGGGVRLNNNENSAGGGGTSSSSSSKKNTAIDNTNRLRKERFLWSLLQVHAILCTSVVERTAHLSSGLQLPPLVTTNIDRGDLQFISTVNNFLTDSPVLCALLDRQSIVSSSRVITTEKNKGSDSCTNIAGINEEGKAEGGNKSDDNMSLMAYDMMMGNFGRRVALFVSEDEKRDAADVLNATPWQVQEINDDGEAKVDALAVTADSLMQLLEKRMRDLEAETCRRLISWEDEKYYSALGGEQQCPTSSPGKSSLSGNRSNNGTVDAMSVNDLFMTLQSLDDELEKMEYWIQNRATLIKPITDECRGIEEENRMLEQQWVSYETLGTELKRLLNGIVLPQNLMSVLENPASVIKYDSSGMVDIDRSEEGVELIHQAGQALKLALDTAEGEGGIHLLAVSDTVKVLSLASAKFCGSLARIVVTVMERLAKELCHQQDAMIGKNDTHTAIAKIIRETQRQFQAALLAYIKIIEVLALLKPDILPAVRDAYSELVAEGIMSKKRMKFYFASLPGRTSVKIAHDKNFDSLPLPNRSGASVTHDLSDYPPVDLRRPNVTDSSGIMKPVNVEDIETALNEMLPLIAREAYFTAALFGLSSRHLDGRQKKRNFEAAKKSVDNSSQYFRYYMNRICGIASEVDAEGKKVKGDAMLSLVASIHLNEAMDGYIDRNKKGGDHSLSLAYVRATILDLRKKVDKQWVAWVEDQIKWIRTNPGVPPSGKRAGVFASIARLPSYLDHVLLCIKAGRPKDYIPNLAKIKVVSYYLQKMASSLFASLNECAERETTDQQYAANVMRMENRYVTIIDCA